MVCDLGVVAANFCFRLAVHAVLKILDVLVVNGTMIQYVFSTFAAAAACRGSVYNLGDYRVYP